MGCFRVRPGEGEGDGASSVVVAAGTQDGAVGLFPIVTPRDGSGDVARCELAAPTRVLDGGHADIGAFYSSHTGPRTIPFAQ